MAFLSKKEIEKLGFKSIGENVLVSDKCSVYNASEISLGSNVRIDDFCILSAGTGGIYIGNNVHIACYVSLIGKERIEICDFAGISSKCAIYSSSDDYSGNYLTGPSVPDKFRNVDSREVVLKEHSLLGAMCVVLPGVIIGKGTAVGAFSLVNRSLPTHSIASGIPAKVVKKRESKLYDLEIEYKKTV
ncbi:acyltransferase [Salinimicrobium oceani]|uniref:Acyltransferase n=1 Tax=Salinimicrobium oceani TaxID=2722702 RepID=A0ABX1CYV0_9FLAO|nr:acyltransferase [Salinimicrobium oceani]NJW53448.1 acyltransferase [Salinimicrobium oceani]